jgi:ABC-type transporter Mla subunit MlaD
MPKIAHLERENERDNSLVERSDEQLTRAMRATAKASADVAAENIQLVQRTAEVGDDLHRAPRPLAEDSPEVSRALAELLAEQARQNVDTVSAFTRAVNWTEVVEAQSRLIAGSLQRISQFNARYRAFFLRGMVAPPRH